MSSPTRIQEELSSTDGDGNETVALVSSTTDQSAIPRYFLISHRCSMAFTNPQQAWNPRCQHLRHQCRYLALIRKNATPLLLQHRILASQALGHCREKRSKSIHNLASSQPFSHINPPQNLSGRTLHRLPMLSLATYAKQDPCPMDEALEALSRAVDDESLVEQSMKEGLKESPRAGKRRKISFA